MTIKYVIVDEGRAHIIATKAVEKLESVARKYLATCVNQKTRSLEVYKLGDAVGAVFAGYEWTVSVVRAPGAE